MALSFSGVEIRDYCRRGNNILPASVSFAVTGDDYEATPDVVISGGGGTGAEGHAVMLYGHLDSIVIDEPGTGYTTDPTITIGGVVSGGGTGATADAVRTGNTVTSATITNAGGRSVVLTDLTVYDTAAGEDVEVINFDIYDKFTGHKEVQINADDPSPLTVNLSGLNATEGISMNVTVKSNLGNIKDGSIHDVGTIKQAGFFNIEY